MLSAESTTAHRASAGKPMRFAPVAELTRGRVASIKLAEGIAADGTVRPVVIKRARPELAAFAGWHELISDESAVLSCIDHPNVIACLDSGTEGGAYCVLEYAQAGSLEDLLASSDVWRRPRLAVALIADALRGLAACHAARTADGGELKVVHQAPLARHILIGFDGRARIADFTQARLPASSSPHRPALLRRNLVAPEQLEAPEEVDERTDIFLIGATLWELTTGQRLRSANDRATHRRVGQVPLPSGVGLMPPRCLDDVCMRALAPNPRERFASADEMLDALLDAARQADGIASAPEVAKWAKKTDAQRARSGEATPYFSSVKRGGAKPVKTRPAPAPLGRESAPSRQIGIGAIQVLCLVCTLAAGDLAISRVLRSAPPRLVEPDPFVADDAAGQEAEPAPTSPDRGALETDVPPSHAAGESVGVQARAVEMVTTPEPARVKSPGPVALPAVHHRLSARAPIPENPY